MKDFKKVKKHALNNSSSSPWNNSYNNTIKSWEVHIHILASEL